MIKTKLEGFHNMTVAMEQINNELFIQPLAKMKNDVETFKKVIKELNPYHVKLALKVRNDLIYQLNSLYIPKLYFYLRHYQY